MDKKITRIFIENIKNAYKGKKIWKRIERENEFKKEDWAILLPSLNKEYNYFGLLYLNQFMTVTKSKRAIILTCDDAVIKTTHLFSDKIQKVIFLSKKECELLIKYYCMYIFTRKLVIVSLEEPEGRVGKGIVNEKGVTIEELIAMGVYGIKEFKREKRITYEGKDNLIKEFLRITD